MGVVPSEWLEKNHSHKGGVVHRQVGSYSRGPLTTNTNSSSNQVRQSNKRAMLRRHPPWGQRSRLLLPSYSVGSNNSVTQRTFSSRTLSGCWRKMGRYAVTVMINRLIESRFSTPLVLGCSLLSASLFVTHRLNSTVFAESSTASSVKGSKSPSSFFQLSAKDIDGNDISFEQFAGKVSKDSY